MSRDQSDPPGQPAGSPRGPSPSEDKVLPIVEAGHPVLRAVARQLSFQEITSPLIADLIESMRETMRAAPGVGLAAPQIGESLALAVIEDRASYHAHVPEAELASRERVAVPFHVIINPRVEVLDAGPVEFLEGCLSVPGYAAVTPRALAVRVHALDHRGEPKVIEARGWYARILQHEIDHLGGTLYVDRMVSRTFASTRSVAPPAARGR